MLLNRDAEGVLVPPPLPPLLPVPPPLPAPPPVGCKGGTGWRPASTLAFLRRWRSEWRSRAARHDLRSPSKSGSGWKWPHCGQGEGER